jgi:glycosyl transferase, family 25
MNAFSVYVINLARRADRCSEMQKELSRVGWKATFFPAIEPSSAAGFESIGAHGCFLSHLSVLKAARDTCAKRLIILEDDLNFGPAFRERWPLLESELESLDWSICYPGHAIGDLPRGISLLSPEHSVPCSHFIAIDEKAINSLIEGLESMLSRPAGDPRGGPMHVDGAYSTIRAQNPSLKTYAVFPVLGYQRPSRTDIRRARWFDRLVVLKPLVLAMRKVKAHRRSRGASG